MIRPSDADDLAYSMNVLEAASLLAMLGILAGSSRLSAREVASAAVHQANEMLRALARHGGEPRTVESDLREDR